MFVGGSFVRKFMRMQNWRCLSKKRKMRCQLLEGDARPLIFGNMARNIWKNGKEAVRKPKKFVSLSIKNNHCRACNDATLHGFPLQETQLQTIDCHPSHLPYLHPVQYLSLKPNHSERPNRSTRASISVHYILKSSPFLFPSWPPNLKPSIL